MIDTTARRECAQAFAGLQQLLGSDLVFRGRTDLPAPGFPAHEAQPPQNGGTFHIDPRVLDSANTDDGKKRVLTAALHETVHAKGWANHADKSPTNPDYSVDDYFKYINGGGKNSCVQP